MLKTTIRHTHFFLICIFICISLGSCFVIDKSLFNGIITAKHLWVQGFSILAIVFVVINFMFSKSIHIKTPDLLAFTFCLWMICRELFSSMPYANPQKHILCILIYFCIYLFFRSIGNSSKIVRIIITLYLIIICTQAIIGLLQLYGFQYSHHALFKITGTFHNPGPFSGFIVSGLPMALGLYLGTRKSLQPEVNSNQDSVISKQFWVDSRLGKVLSSEFWVQYNWNRILNYFAQIVIVVLLLVLPAARSRAAWLGGIVGCIFVLLNHKGPLRNITTRLKDTLRNSALSLRFSVLPKKRYAVPLLILIIFSSLLGLYKFKQGSADGRLLMWQVSLEMIKDKPILGWGQGGFEANYANYQAEWFKSGKGTKAQEMVAGSPEAPFNELIRIIINYGLIGLVFIFILLLSLFRKNSKRTIDNDKKSLQLIVLQKGGVVSIIVFSLFSYPIDVSPIFVQLILLVTILINHSPNHAILNLEYRKPIKLLAIPLSISILLVIVLDLRNNNIGLKYWNEAYQLYQLQMYEDSIDGYIQAQRYIRYNGHLLQMQSKCLVMNRQYDEAINTILKAKIWVLNPIICNILGECYSKMGRFKDAEQAYLKASYMEPHKFYPQYLLAKLYYENRQTIKAQKITEYLLTKEVKISSYAITEMKNELKRLLQE